MEYPAVADNDPLVQRIKDGRGGRLINLYRMQLYNPGMAGGWLDLGSAIRFQAELDSPAQELAICLVARLTGSEYEWRAHRRLALAQGLTEQQLDMLLDWRAKNHFDARQQALLAVTEALTSSVDVDDATFDALRDHFTPRQIVELVATVAYYNMVSRFLVGLKIDLEPA